MSYRRGSRPKYSVGGAIGTAIGAGLNFIPGVGPAISAVATPLLSAAGTAIEKKMTAPEQEEINPVTPANPNAYSAVRTFKFGGKPQLKSIKGPKHEQGGVPLKDATGNVIGEVEGGETKLVTNGEPEFIFSDSVTAPNGDTFADVSKELSDKPEQLKKLANLQEVMKGQQPVYKKGGRVKYAAGGGVNKALDIAALVAPVATAAIGQGAYKTPELQTNKGFDTARAMMPKRFSLDAARVGARQSEINTTDAISRMSGSRQGLRAAVVSNRAKTLDAQNDIAMKEQQGQIALDQARANLEVQAGQDAQTVANQNAAMKTQARNARVAVGAQALKGVGEAAVGIRKDRLAEQADLDRMAIIGATSRTDIDPDLLGKDTYERIYGSGSYGKAMNKRTANAAKSPEAVLRNLAETAKTVEEDVAIPTITPNSTPADIQEYINMLNRSMKFGGKVMYKRGGKVKYC